MKALLTCLSLAGVVVLLCGCPPGAGPGALTFNVTYNANGAHDGAVPTDENSYEQGATVTVPGNTGNLETVPDVGTMDDFVGESPKESDVWTLTIADNVSGDTGQTLEWVLWFYLQ